VSAQATVMVTAPMYQQEVSQQLNRDLAMYNGPI
jgi:hypothetical protein